MKKDKFFRKGTEDKEKNWEGSECQILATPLLPKIYKNLT